MKKLVFTLFAIVFIFSLWFAPRELHGQILSFEDSQINYSLNGPFKTQIMDFPDLTDQKRKRKVPIKMHLPIGKGPFPVVIISHGGGGSRDANFAQANHLATHGYIAVCLEHIRSNTATVKKTLNFIKNLKSMIKDASEVLGRPKDVSFAIEHITRMNSKSSRLKGCFDLEKIGILGHSFGAYTTLVACGARPSLDGLEPTVLPGKGLGPDLRDQRIKCGVALSPQGPGRFFNSEENYSGIATPLMGITGSEDKQGDKTALIRLHGFKLWPAGDKIFVWLEGAGHLGFSDSTGSGKGKLLHFLSEPVQPVVRAATLIFFNAHLGGNENAKKLLNKEFLKKYLTDKINGVRVFHR